MRDGEYIGKNESGYTTGYVGYTPKFYFDVCRPYDLVAGLIRGKPAGEAVTALTFSSKAMAVDVKKCLQSAIANAENNHNLDVDRLWVKEASVGKSISMKRFATRARGRSSRIVKPFSKLRIVVQERDVTEGGDA